MAVVWRSQNDGGGRNGRESFRKGRFVPLLWAAGCRANACRISRGLERAANARMGRSFGGHHHTGCRGYCIATIACCCLWLSGRAMHPVGGPRICSPARATLRYVLFDRIHHPNVRGSATRTAALPPTKWSLGKGLLTTAERVQIVLEIESGCSMGELTEKAFRPGRLACQHTPESSDTVGRCQRSAHSDPRPGVARPWFLAAPS